MLFLDFSNILLDRIHVLFYSFNLLTHECIRIKLPFSLALVLHTNGIKTDVKLHLLEKIFHESRLLASTATIIVRFLRVTANPLGWESLSKSYVLQHEVFITPCSRSISPTSASSS